MSDVPCLVSCLCWAARRTGQEIMTRGCCCASHSEWRTRARLTSCLADHATPGSGTAAISKFLSAWFCPSRQNCMCVFSFNYSFVFSWHCPKVTFVWSFHFLKPNGKVIYNNYSPCIFVSIHHSHKWCILCCLWHTTNDLTKANYIENVLYSVLRQSSTVTANYIKI